ncbi:response regulator [Granulicella arctica]|uniref:DNA-binding response OmpR family regulator n=1 Tax=Granulicella arctica TaxID=940613 RepID=A0A7Y9TG59_9BACT|nr:response regulator [Granulicella arctica]NYF78385.1 DNA-binding response OmpR family regulator [Granulicella arctica]
MKRKILLVDDEVAVLLTLKAVLEISGFEVDTAASAKEAKSKLKKREYAMVITDLRMESDAAGREVIQVARSAAYHPAVALLTAFPIAEEDWQEMGADNMLVKPMHTKILLEQIAALLASHEAKLERLIALQASHDEQIESLLATHDAEIAAVRAGRGGLKKSAARKALPAKKKAVAKKVAVKKAPAKKTTTKAPVTQVAAKKATVAKKAAKKVAKKAAKRTSRVR